MLIEYSMLNVTIYKMKNGLILIIILIFEFNSALGQKKRWIEPEQIDTTIYLNNGFVVQLTPANPTDFDEYFMTNKLIDSLTREHSNFYNKSLAIEQYLLPKYAEYVRRDSNDLAVKLTNGTWLTLKNNPEYDEVGHTFEYYFKDLQIFSIRVQFGEGNCYKLVNAKDGRITFIIGRPYFSPNGELIISLGNDIEAGYSINGFQLLRNKNGTISEIGKYEPSSWGCESAKWLDNKSFILRNESIEFGDSGVSYFNFFAIGQLK